MTTNWLAAIFWLSPLVVCLILPPTSPYLG
jgi:hypothetical protein